MKMFVGLVAGAFLAAGALRFLGGAFQRQQTFYPLREREESMLAEAPEKGMEPWLANGLRIGWRVAGPPGGHPALYLHGNGGNGLSNCDFAKLLHGADPSLDVYVLEYPGYGSRRGKPSEETFVRAAQEALAALPKNEKPLVIGYSLGTAVASQIAKAAPDKIAGLFLVAPFDSLESLAKLRFPFFPVGLLLADTFDSSDALSGYAGRCAIFVAGEDRTTPPESARRLYAAQNGPKRIWEFPGAGHGDLPDLVPPRTWAEALAFASGRAD